MSVGEKIKNYLNDNGISQTHISSVTGIPFIKLNYSLNGKRKLQFEEYELICGALNIPIDTFLEPKKPGGDANGC